LKKRIATGATVVAIGGLAGVALSTNKPTSKSPSEKPLVRTQVIRRTIHVTRHEKPKHPISSGEGGSGVHAVAAESPYGSATTGASSSGTSPSSSSASPVTTSTSSTSVPASSEGSGSAPVTTGASGGATAAGGGAGGGDEGGEGEHEAGGDD
jgi:hypothetical protein